MKDLLAVSARRQPATLTKAGRRTQERAAPFSSEAADAG
jgi:hypothetical protein